MKIKPVSKVAKRAFSLVELCIGMLLSLLLLGLLSLVCMRVQLESKQVSKKAAGFAHDADWLEFVEKVAPYRLHEDGSSLRVAVGAECSCIGWYYQDSVCHPRQVVYRMVILRALLPQELQRHASLHPHACWGGWLLTIDAAELEGLLQRGLEVHDLVPLVQKDPTLAADAQLMHLFSSPPQLLKSQNAWQLAWQNEHKQCFVARVGALLAPLEVAAQQPH